MRTLSNISGCLTDPALKAAVERVTEIAYHETAKIVLAKLGLKPADLRTLLAALSSQASVMEEMAKGLDPVALLAADGETKGVNMHDPISKWLTVADLQNARTALSQYRTLGGE